MKQLDQDESGMVEFPEFVRVMAKRAESARIAQKEQEFREAFEVETNQELVHFNLLLDVR